MTTLNEAIGQFDLIRDSVPQVELNDEVTVAWTHDSWDCRPLAGVCHYQERAHYFRCVMEGYVGQDNRGNPLRGRILAIVEMTDEQVQEDRRRHMLFKSDYPKYEQESKTWEPKNFGDSEVVAWWGTCLFDQDDLVYNLRSVYPKLGKIRHFGQTKVRQAIQRVPKVKEGKDFEMMWSVGHYDGPRTGVCRYQGKEHWFECVHESQRSLKRTYVVVTMTPEGLAVEQQRQALFQEHVGKHCSYVYEDGKRKRAGEYLKDRDHSLYYKAELPRSYDLHEEGNVVAFWET